jgi:hypothetical protein
MLCAGPTYLIRLELWCDFVRGFDVSGVVVTYLPSKARCPVPGWLCNSVPGGIQMESRWPSVGHGLGLGGGSGAFEMVAVHRFDIGGRRAAGMAGKGPGEASGPVCGLLKMFGLASDLLPTVLLCFHPHFSGCSSGLFFRVVLQRSINERRGNMYKRAFV